jgi:PBP1b-binding outer membrane lipoprotein LpoB
MIKMILTTAMMATLFTGCVGTVIADNNIKKNPSSTVQNAKSTLQQETNATKKEVQ